MSKKYSEAYFQGKGLVGSPQDNRDILTSNIIPEIKRYPKEYPMPFDLTVSDQKTTPHCCGHAGAGVKEFQEKRERHDVLFDGDWLYKECKKIDNYDGDGTYLRAVFQVLKNVGAKPLNGTEAEAANYKISAYARVDDLSFEGLKKHIAVYGNLLAGFKGSNEGWANENIRPPKTGEKIWGHATNLVAFIEKFIKGKNSWGTDWGDNGYFNVPATYQPFEAWVVLLDSPTEKVQAPTSGWIALPYVNLAKIGNRGTITATTLNVRNNPNGEVVGKLRQGEEVEILEETKAVGDYTWVRIKI